MSCVNPCDNCYCATLLECANEIKIGGLPIDTEITLRFTDRHGNIHATTKTTDSDGYAEVTLNDDVPMLQVTAQNTYIVNAYDSDMEQVQFIEQIGYETKRHDCIRIEVSKCLTEIDEPQEIL